MEDHRELWRLILSDMKLTHLAIDYSVLFSSVQNELVLITLFQKCTRLLALELSGKCWASYKKNVSILSHLTSLVHCKIDIFPNAFVDISQLLGEILTSCKKVKCLTHLRCTSNLNSVSLSPYLNLQQIYIHSCLGMPATFFTAISAHGGLVHVVLYVQSVTREGVAALIWNSPKLITFHSLVDQICDDKDGDTVAIKALELKEKLKQNLSMRQLFVIGSFQVETSRCCGNHFEERHLNTDLFSLWDVH